MFRTHYTSLCGTEEENGSFSSSSNASCLVRRPAGSLSCAMPAQKKTSAALQTHSEAEKRRRDRINAHLSTLRCMIPNSAKSDEVETLVRSLAFRSMCLGVGKKNVNSPIITMDKASLLGRVVEQVKDLKRMASDTSRVSRVPGQVDQVSVECSTSYNYKRTSSIQEGNCLYINASVCCEDRPQLFAELSEALQSLRLRTIKAEIISLGGRMQCVFTLCGNKEEDVCMTSFEESIKHTLGVVVSREKEASNPFLGRRRRYKSHHC